MIDTEQDQSTDQKSWFNQLFSIYESSLNGHKNEAFSLFRLQGHEAFAKMDFPTRKNEDWRYTSITPIVNQKYKEGTAQALTVKSLELDAYTISYVNGKLQTTSLPTATGLTILTVEQALKNDQYKSWIYDQLAVEGGTSQNTFLPLNQAFAAQGLFIKIDKNSVLDKPVVIQHHSTTDGQQPFMAHPQTFIWADTGSQAEIAELYTSADETTLYFTNAAHRIAVGKNAKLLLLKIQHESFGAYQVNNAIVTQDRDSVFNHYAIDIGGQTVRNNLSIKLLDSNTESFMYGAFIGFKDQHIDNQSFIDHAVPHCQSNEMYKGILGDKSRGVFNGKILVRQDAQKTNAFQQSSSLVLSPTAIMDTKPQLEIFADDVKCSHGATIGHLDESSLFYLTTRGLSEKQAKSLLKRAYISEVVDHIDNLDLRELAYAAIEEKLDLMQI